MKEKEGSFSYKTDTIKLTDPHGTSVTIEAGPHIVEIWDWEPIIAGVLVSFGFHPDNVYDLFHQPDKKEEIWY